MMLYCPVCGKPKEESKNCPGCRETLEKGNIQTCRCGRAG